MPMIENLGASKDRQESSLTDFIEKNHKLISTAGVLAALSVLANKLPDNQSGKFLSFLLLILVLIICLEIDGNFPWVEKRGKLHWFQVVFSLAVFVFCGAWVSILYPLLFLALLMIVGMLVALLAVVLCAAVIRKLVLRIPWFKGVNQRTKEMRIPMFGAIALLAIGFGILRHFKFFWRH
jgi:hypothetical protein